jgi:hypothetical protein
MKKRKTVTLTEFLRSEKLDVEEPPRKTSRQSREISQSCIGSWTR